MAGCWSQHESEYLKHKERRPYSHKVSTLLMAGCWSQHESEYLKHRKGGNTG